MYERISAQRNAIISECVADLPADQEAALVAALSALENLADKLRVMVRGDRNNLIRDNPRAGEGLIRSATPIASRGSSLFLSAERGVGLPENREPDRGIKLAAAEAWYRPNLAADCPGGRPG